MFDIVDYDIMNKVVVFGNVINLIVGGLLLICEY